MKKHTIVAVVMFVVVGFVGCSESSHLGALDKLVERAPCGATVTYSDGELTVEVTKSCKPEAEPEKKETTKPVAQKTEPTPAK